VPKTKRKSATAPSAHAAPAFIPPYPPSWLNRLIDWVDRRRGPLWIYYVAGIGLMALVLGLGDVITLGSLQVTTGTGALLYAVYPVYFVALMHYLDRQATQALGRFRPALDVRDDEYARLAYRLTTVPATGAWIATALGIPLAVVFGLSGETLPLSPARLPIVVLSVVFTEFTIACFLILGFHTIRQLRQVSELHRAAATINLLQPRPTYAFSRLTSRTAIGVLAFLYFDFLVNPPTPGVALPYFVFTAAAVLLMSAAFLWPLLGMHQRLAAEKVRLESEVNQGVETVYQDLQRQAKRKTYKNVDELDKALAGFLRMRDVVARLSTWPWQPETLRGVLAAVGLPILIWLIQYGLQRWIG